MHQLGRCWHVPDAGRSIVCVQLQLRGTQLTWSQRRAVHDDGISLCCRGQLAFCRSQGNPMQGAQAKSPPQAIRFQRLPLGWGGIARRVQRTQCVAEGHALANTSELWCKTCNLPCWWAWKPHSAVPQVAYTLRCCVIADRRQQVRPASIVRGATTHVVCVAHLKHGY